MKMNTVCFRQRSAGLMPSGQYRYNCRNLVVVVARTAKSVPILPVGRWVDATSSVCGTPDICSGSSRNRAERETENGYKPFSMATSQTYHFPRSPRGLVQKDGHTLGPHIFYAVYLVQRYITAC